MTQIVGSTLKDPEPAVVVVTSPKKRSATEVSLDDNSSIGSSNSNKEHKQAKTHQDKNEEDEEGGKNKKHAEAADAAVEAEEMEKGDGVLENFTSDQSSEYYAQLYKQHNLTGGHVIMLGPGNEEAALAALKAYPKGMQVGGGITPENAEVYLAAGASHVIVTSYVFCDGKIDFERLEKLKKVVGKERLVLDVSCRKKPGDLSGAYYVVTDRWQKFSDQTVTAESLASLAVHCDEFLVHGVDVEGKKQGIEEELVRLLGDSTPIPTTYAGGVRSLEDLRKVRTLGKGRVDITIGSALDIFGGELPMVDAIKACD